MKYDFHGLIVEAHSPDAAIAARWEATFASRPQVADGEPQIRFGLACVDHVPAAPPGEPHFRQDDLLRYYVRGAEVVAHFPRFGQIRLDLSTGEIEGRILAEALRAHGVFEDLTAIGLSPLLRRRGMFLIHAFGASLPHSPAPSPAGRGKAVLIVGDIGAGKTTTGLSLLHAGWKLLSNDSPILKDSGEIEALSYPGLLSAYPDSILRFPELHRLVGTNELSPTIGPRRKIMFAAEDFYAEVWTDRAPAGAIVFPQIEHRADHALERLAAPEALRMILPHAIEQWDQEMIPTHLALLTKLVETTPAYRLRLGTDVGGIPSLLAGLVGRLTADR